jgi:hypothetical protein
MTYTVSIQTQFAAELARTPSDLQSKVLDFTMLYQVVGLGDFSKFPGKIAPSWSGLSASDPVFSYATTNDLWHYHVGYPHYNQRHPQYQTSDWLLHFQWPGRGSHITLVDLYQHYTSAGAFYMPPPGALVP